MQLTSVKVFIVNILYHLFIILVQTDLEIYRSGRQGWQYGTVRSEFAYYVPCTLNRTVPSCRTSVQFLKRTVPKYRTRNITKKAYRTSVPYFLAKIEAYRTVTTYRTAILAGRVEKILTGSISAPTRY